MKRDLDLIRKILISVEEQTGYDAFDGVYELANYINEDDVKKVAFHASLLVECNYIKAIDISSCGMEHDDYVIQRLTSDGFDYLDNIRSDTVWNSTKEKLSTLGGAVSLDVVKNIAGKIIMATLSI